MGSALQGGDLTQGLVRRDRSACLQTIGLVVTGRQLARYKLHKEDARRSSVAAAVTVDSRDRTPHKHNAKLPIVTK